VIELSPSARIERDSDEHRRMRLRLGVLVARLDDVADLYAA